LNSLSPVKAAFWIVAWSLLVHVPGITSPLLDYHAHRQCQTASMARDYFRHGMHFFRPETDLFGPSTWSGTEFPLYSYLLAVGYKLFGLHEILGRLLSVFLTAWSALFLFAFVRRRLGNAVGLWSALVMCSIPAHIYFTRTVQPESMALWAFLGFLNTFDRWLLASRRRDLLFALALGTLAPLLKLPFAYLVIGMWGVFGWQSGSLRRPFYWLIPVIMMGLTEAWYAYAKHAPGQVLPLGIKDQLQNLAPILKRHFWESHFVSRFPEICATYTGLALGIYGAVGLWKRREKLWFLWFGVTVFYTVLLGQYGWTHTNKSVI